MYTVFASAFLLFFKPLITLIKHFKSTFIDFAKIGLRYDFGDKIDSGGNSNMLKIFDDVKCIIHFVVLANSGYNAQFGLYDTEHSTKYNILLKDHYDNFGSIQLYDNLKIIKK